MSKYTKETWGLEKSLKLPEVEYAASIISLESGREICRIVNYETSIEETKANAQLVAAAPELLENAKSIIRELFVFGSVHNPEIVDNLEKAIKKAEGENNA